MNPFDNYDETEEDWDWGLFISNLMHKKRRMKRYFLQINE